MPTPATGPQDPTLAALEAVFGPPSSAGFGSAVFRVPLPSPGGLEAAAREVYRAFVGPLWERWGEDAWMGPWTRVYERAGRAPDTVAALRGIEDPSAAGSVSVLLEGGEDPARAQAALAAALDDPAVTDLAVYRIGDGAAMSGLLLAGARAASGDAVLLAFLMD